MIQIRCTDCGQVFDENLKECPNCGCPASDCEKIVDSKSNSEDQDKQENKKEIIHPTSELSNDKESCYGLIECSDCGTKISIDAKRCPHCGSKGKFAPLDYGNAIYDCFCRKYYCFTGRSRRSEVFPFIILAGMMCGTLIVIKSDDADSSYVKPELIPFLITLLPVLGAIVRRLHDIGRSGWWVLLPVVPEIFIFKDSDKKENEYGKSPKYQPEYYREELPDKGTIIGKVIAIVTVVLLAIQIIGMLVVMI